MTTPNPEITEFCGGITIRLDLPGTEVITQAAKTPYITTGELAEKVGLTRNHINSLASKIPGAYQLEKTKLWLFPYTAVEFIKNRPYPKMGRPKKQ